MWRSLSVLMVGTFMAILDVFIVLVAAPSIQADLHATSAQVQLILAGYQLTYAIALITGARLGDRYGRKRLFMTGMAVFTVASAACGAAPDAASLIVGRLVQGLGAALMFPQVFTMIQVLAPDDQRHRAFGALGAVISMSTIMGQLVGGLIISANIFGSEWRPVFWVNVPIGILTLLLCAKLVPETRAPQARRLDGLGVGVLTVALSLLVVPLIEGRQAGWPAWTWLSLVGSAVAFAAFVAVERRVERRGGDPLVALRLFGERPFSVGMGLVLATYAGLNSFFLVLSLVLQEGLGLSPLSAGLAYTPEAVVFFAASIAAGRLAPRFGRRLLEIGAVLVALGYASTVIVAATLGSDLTVGAIIPTLMLQGLGGGLLVTPLLNAILSRIGPSEVGMASGVLATTQQVGGALGVAVIGVLFFGALDGSGHGDYAHGLAVGVGFNLAVAAVGAALVFALRSGKAAASD